LTSKGTGAEILTAELGMINVELIDGQFLLYGIRKNVGGWIEEAMSDGLLIAVFNPMQHNSIFIRF
jgi:hypothetical protein